MPTRNERLLKVFLEKLRRDYADDISLAFIYGSAVTGNAHAKSDLDLVFVPRTDRGHALSMCFVVEDVGYDFFPMSWERLEGIAAFAEALVSVVADAKVVYSAAPKEKKRFTQLQKQIARAVEGPLTPALLQSAGRFVDEAMMCAARMQLSDSASQARTWAGGVLEALSVAVCFMNNRFFRLGTKRRLEELRALPRLPDRFMKHYAIILQENRGDLIRTAAWRMLAAVRDMHEALSADMKPRANLPEALTGTYEEMVCNWKHKLSAAVESGDAPAAFLNGVYYQGMLDDLAQAHGIARVDILRGFHADNLPVFRRALADGEQAYLDILKKHDVPLRVYPSVDAFAEALLG